MTEHGFDGATDDVREQLGRFGIFMRRSLRFWRLALAFVVVGAVACGAFLVLRGSMYRSETVILYSEGVRMTDDAERPDSSRSVTLRLREVLMSRTTLDTVVREFNLYPDVRRTLGPIDAVEELRRHVVFRSPGGDTFSIAFTGSSPELAQRVTSRLAELVIGQDSDLRRKQAIVTREFLVAEEQRTEAALRAREEELASFMALHPRFAFDSTPLSTGAAIRASLGATPVASPPSGVMRSAGGVSSTGNVPRASGAPGPQGGGDTREATAEVTRATAAVAAARANLTDLATHFTAAHPDVRAAEAELERETNRLAQATAAARTATERGALDTERARSAESAAPPAPIAPPRVVVTPSKGTPAPVAAASALAKPKPDVVALETDWVKLTRGVTEARQHQDQVEAALFKASIAASSESGGQGGEVTVIDPAFLPRSPVPPGRTTIVGIFIAVSLLLGAFAAIARTFLDDRVYDAGDLAGLSGMLAEIPRASSRRAHVGS